MVKNPRELLMVDMVRWFLTVGFMGFSGKNGGLLVVNGGFKKPTTG